MASYVAVMTHPYFDVTGTDGTFKIDGVPAGNYEVEIWHEKLKTKTSKVTVAVKTIVSPNTCTFLKKPLGRTEASIKFCSTGPPIIASPPL